MEPKLVDPPRRGLIRRLLPLLILGAGLGLFFALGLQRHLTLSELKQNREALSALVTAHPYLAPALFAGVYALAMAVSVPASWVFTVSAGFLFGIVEGSAVAIVAATTGATIIYLATRTALADLIERHSGAAVRKFEAGFRANAFNYLLALRLVPVVPFFLVNIAAGLLGVSFRTFLIATFFGIIPACVIYAGIGNGLGTLFDRGAEPDLHLFTKPEIIAPLAALALLSLLPIIWRTLRRKKPA